MEKRFLNTVDSSYAFLFGTIISQVGVFAFLSIVMFIANLFKFSSEEVQTFFNGAVGYLISSVVLLSFMFFVFLFFQRRSKEKIVSKLNIKKVFIYLSLGCLAFFMLSPVINCVDSLLNHLGFKLNTITYPLTTPNYFISIISLCLLPAIFEELLFRGVIFKGLSKNGKVFSIVVSAIMFSLGHLTISQTIYPFVMGMFFAVIMFRENNILYTILAHACCNFLSLNFSYFNISLVFNHWTYILMAIILFAAFVCVLLYFVFKDSKKVEKNALTKREKIILSACMCAMLILWIVSLVSSKI